MSDLALDPLTRDLELPPRVISGPEQITQAVNIHLRTWIGEWFLDLDHGVPYLTEVLGKRRPEMVEAVLRQHILGVDGVQSITSFHLKVDQRTRLATATWEGETEAGTAGGTVSVGL
jgi:hypothetical protein